jgi:hypothetical protein
MHCFKAAKVFEFYAELVYWIIYDFSVLDHIILS